MSEEEAKFPVLVYRPPNGNQEPKVMEYPRFIKYVSYIEFHGLETVKKEYADMGWSCREDEKGLYFTSPDGKWGHDHPFKGGSRYINLAWIMNLKVSNENDEEIGQRNEENA